MDKSTYEKIARLFDLVAEMNVLTLSLRQAKVAVEFGSSGASRADRWASGASPSSASSSRRRRSR